MVIEENIYEETKNIDNDIENSQRKIEEQFEKNLPPAFMLNLPTYNISKLKEELSLRHTGDKEDTPESKNFSIWMESLQHKIKLKKIYGEFIRDRGIVLGAIRV